MKAIVFSLFFIQLSLAETKFDEFHIYQWGLNNSGKTISHKVSDIDTIQVSSKENEDINIPHITEKKKIIKVAVIDSGIDILHPDLKDIIYKNESECRALKKYKECLKNSEKEVCEELYAKVDSDNNGYPLDCNGWNFAAPTDSISGITGNNNPQDLIGHGSFVSGIIAAAKNGSGIQGIVENVKIIPIKVSGSDVEVSLDNSTDIFARGIDYAIAAKADIINLSVGWGFNQNSLLVTEALKKAIQNNILVVVAAGNASHSSLSYPCAFNEVICVGAFNPDGRLSHFSNKGSSVDILAPGFKILSTWPLSLRSVNFTQRTGYEYKDGTSFAAPFVVGALAKLLNQGFSPEVSKIKLYQGARENKTKGLILNGNLDVERAIESTPLSFIYPYKKTPAIVNWDKKEKRIRLSYKNYNMDAKDITLKLRSSNAEIVVRKPVYKIDLWKKNEVKELDFHVSGPDVIDSEMSFTLEIDSLDESKFYPVQVIASSIIHDKFNRQDAELTKGKFRSKISQHTIKAFKNISRFENRDYLVINESKEKVSWALLKYTKGAYHLSKLQNTNLDKALLPHMARVDIDQDGREDYVIFAYQQDEDLNWVIKIFIYDSNFKKKEYKLNNNELKSDITTINTSIEWVKLKDEVVPIWISDGYIPSEDLPHLSPWDHPTINSFEQRIYFLSQKRLHYYPIKLDGEEEEDLMPKAFFPQSVDERLNFKLKVLSFDKNIFFRNYYRFEINSNSVPKTYKIDQYTDITEAVNFSTPLNRSQYFSEFDLSKEETLLSIFSSNNLNVDQISIPYKTGFDSIQAIIPSDKVENGIYALTKYNILFHHRNKNYLTENRNISNQVSYKSLSKQRLYMSSNDSPGLSSELISFSQEENKLISPSNYRFLKFGSCIELEFGFNMWSKQYSANFFCESNKKFIKVKL